jgi:hypothetical protein
MSPLVMRFFTLVGIALAMACMQMKARADGGPQAPRLVQPSVAAAQPDCAAARLRRPT